MFINAQRSKRRKRRRKRKSDDPLRVVGYCRVSTAMQADGGASLSVQEDGIRDYCRARKYELVEVLIDAGISGRIAPDQRPGLARAIERIVDDEADGIIVYKLDRLSRSMYDCVSLSQEFGKHNYHLTAVCDSIDTTSPMGRFFFHIMASLAEMESARTGERVKDGMRKKSEDMKCMSRFTPFGWRLETPDGPWEAATRQRDSENQKCGEREQRKLVVNPQEMTMLNEIVALTTSGVSPYKIAKDMNSSNRLHPRTSKPWHTATIIAITKTVERRASYHKEYATFAAPVSEAGIT